MILSYFFFNDAATTEIYTLSLHDALPISQGRVALGEEAHPAHDLGELAAGQAQLVLVALGQELAMVRELTIDEPGRQDRSEEHTSELQSRQYLVCRLLLEKKKQKLT